MIAVSQHAYSEYDRHQLSSVAATATNSWTVPQRHALAARIGVEMTSEAVINRESNHSRLVAACCSQEEGFATARIEKRRLLWAGIRGRNGAVSPLALADDECVEAINGDFYDGELCQKRRGSIAIPRTSGPSSTSAANVCIPPAGEAQAEVFATDQTTIYRYRPIAGVYGWSSPSVTDATLDTTPSGRVGQRTPRAPLLMTASPGRSSRTAPDSCG